ncbi:H-type lectin domain-containing protein [Bradyrhizobium pachyrhizi]|nr:H-type lectin domain-containing protein [Bradyrhizobium pachyrhizi]
METIAGIATLGSSAAGSLVPEGGTKGTYKYAVTFGTPFPKAPVVVATPLQGTNYTGNIADTFGIAVTAVTEKGFTVNVNRLDALNGGWDQNLRLQYIASL